MRGLRPRTRGSGNRAVGAALEEGLTGHPPAGPRPDSMAGRLGRRGIVRLSFGRSFQPGWARLTDQGQEGTVEATREPEQAGGQGRAEPEARWLVEGLVAATRDASQGTRGAPKPGGWADGGGNGDGVVPGPQHSGEGRQGEGRSPEGAKSRPSPGECWAAPGPPWFAGWASRGPQCPVAQLHSPGLIFPNCNRPSHEGAAHAF